LGQPDGLEHGLQPIGILGGKADRLLVGWHQVFGHRLGKGGQRVPLSFMVLVVPIPPVLQRKRGPNSPDASTGMSLDCRHPMLLEDPAPESTLQRQDGSSNERLVLGCCAKYLEGALEASRARAVQARGVDG
jgi:hypothetical protein